METPPSDKTAATMEIKESPLKPPPEPLPVDFATSTQEGTKLDREER